MRLLKEATSTIFSMIAIGCFGLLIAKAYLYVLSPPVTDEKVYQIVYGKVLCAYAQETQCGLTLKNCADGREYQCMQNVFSQQD